MGCGDADIALAWISPPGYKNPDTTDAVPVQLGGVTKEWNISAAISQSRRDCKAAVPS